MFNPYRSGEWALYKGQIVQVLWIDHKAPYRVCISFESHDKDYILGNDYVHNSALTKLDPAVSDLIGSIHNV